MRRAKKIIIIKDWEKQIVKVNGTEYALKMDGWY